MDRNLEELARTLFTEKLEPVADEALPLRRQPVHVVYGGADRFTPDVSAKFGLLAVRSLDTFAPDGESLLEVFKTSRTGPVNIEADALISRVRSKLETEPVEDFRIDFEDGFGFRSDEEEDTHASRCGRDLAVALESGTAPAFTGVRIKSFQKETFTRACRTLDLFFSALLGDSPKGVPDGFVVTLPKIKRPEEVTVLDELLSGIEASNSLPQGAIGIELMVETPDCLFSLRELVRAGAGRVTAAHFGAYDYTAALGITARHQHLRHGACDFARQMMQAALSPLGVRLCDSVTTEMPVPVHRGDALSASEREANRKSVHDGWRKHFDNVMYSLSNGFYQSWDLHPAQLVARYAALTAFFIEGADEQGSRLRGFIEKATQATMSGSVFDDAASAQGCLNFFMRAVSCGAMSEDEAYAYSGLTAQDLKEGSFSRIMERSGRKGG